MAVGHQIGDSEGGHAGFEMTKGWFCLALSLGWFVPLQETKSIALSSLTLSPERLPEGCRLSPPIGSQDSRSAEPRVAPYAIRVNPWIGTDRDLIVSIREQTERPIRVPDASISLGEITRLHAEYAAQVEQGYIAIYEHPPHPEVVVTALRFRSGTDPEILHRVRRSSAARLAIERIVIGSTAVSILSDGSGCAVAIAAHVKAVAKS